MMARPYNAWVSDPPAHRYLGNRFAEYNSHSSMMPSPDGMMSSNASDPRLVDVPHHLPPGVPAPTAPIYHSAYGPSRLLPLSASMPAPPPDYGNHPSIPNPASQSFLSTAAKILPGSPRNEAQLNGYQNLRMPGPSPAGVPLPQRLPSLSEQQPPPRNDSVPDYHNGAKRTSTQSATLDQRLAENPPPPNGARRNSHISVPNLIGEARAEALKDIRFRLRLRQQPKAARSCGFGERDRRVIDPPPIVELIIESSTLLEDEIRTYRCYESYVMSCSIWDESGKRDASYMPEEYRHQRRLMGSLVGTPFVGKDEHGKEGCFFTFSDLSCRTPGSFRLKFGVIMIDPLRAGVVRHFPILTEVQSDVFTVYNAKDFPGMVASTQLAHSLKAQGCILQLKKGNDKSKNPKGAQDLSDDDMDENDDEPEFQGKRKRRSTRQ